MPRKRKALSFKEKLEVPSAIDQDPKRKRAQLAKELGLAPSTLNTIVGQREQILKNVQRFGANVKQAKTAQHVNLEEILLTWFKEVTAAGINIDGKVVREKADDIALSLGIDNIQASGGWLQRVKTRHNLVYKTVCGEGKKVDESVVNEWKTATLPSFIAGYEPRDIFNTDEAGLFFNVQPEKSLCFKGQNRQGGEKSKNRITVLFCCNGDGSEKFKLTVIGKFQKPRCFKNAGPLPCVYKANKRAWMTTTIFQEFLIYPDHKMSSKKVLQATVWAKSMEDYTKLLSKLEEVAPRLVLEYFNKNWRDISNEWSLGPEFHVSNFLNSANNRLESLNRDLKSVIKRFSSLEDFVDGLFAVLMNRNDSCDNKAAQAIHKRKVLTFAEEAEQQYYNTPTEFAFNSVKRELHLRHKVKLPARERGTYSLISSSGPTDVTANSCTCCARSSMSLPCRRIFAARELEGGRLVLPGAVPQQVNQRLLQF
ncbi:tigger transposable element-derived protein 6-like [Ornithodoros turicata]|uniref:tigger transposable element-derived protein 6-like n=1 Tax=Ornithodoros turicata TaxID=34597 RepID=UPI0031390B6D